MRIMRHDDIYSTLCPLNAGWCWKTECQLECVLKVLEGHTQS